MQAKRFWSKTEDNISRQLRAATGRQAFRFTVIRRTLKNGLLAFRPECFISLTATHRRHHLHWNKVYKDWTSNK